MTAAMTPASAPRAISTAKPSMTSSTTAAGHRAVAFRARVAPSHNCGFLFPCLQQPPGRPCEHLEPLHPARAGIGALHQYGSKLPR